MAVTSIEELKRLVEEGWVPYFHKGVRRWYIRKGEKTEVISVQLEPYAEEMAARIPRKRNKVKPEVAAEVVRLRKNGGPIGSISECLGLPYRTVENILDRYQSGTLELPNPTGMAQGSEGEFPRSAFDLPEEVEQYMKRLALNVAAEPEKKQLPGYRNSEAYAIPIDDHETGRRLTIVYPLPTYRTEGYETVTVTNMEGRRVKVLAIKGDEEQQLGNPLNHVVWPLLALGAVVGISVGATLIDKFVGPLLGWNPEGRWWWER
jgi:hypothetical protein